MFTAYLFTCKYVCILICSNNCKYHSEARDRKQVFALQCTNAIRKLFMYKKHMPSLKCMFSYINICLGEYALIIYVYYLYKYWYRIYHVHIVHIFVVMWRNVFPGYGYFQEYFQFYEAFLSESWCYNRESVQFIYVCVYDI